MARRWRGSGMVGTFLPEAVERRRNNPTAEVVRGRWRPARAGPIRSKWEDAQCGPVRLSTPVTVRDVFRRGTHDTQNRSAHEVVRV